MSLLRMNKTSLEREAELSSGMNTRLFGREAKRLLG
jgi:hypothetical protein